jgi:hypothetical protein
MKAYRAFLCPPLASAMDAARVRQRVYMQRNRRETAAGRGATCSAACSRAWDVATPAGTEVDADSARVTMSMRFGEGDEPAALEGRGAAGARRGQLCIADVEYRGDWPFANKGKLSQTWRKALLCEDALVLVCALDRNYAIGPRRRPCPGTCRTTCAASRRSRSGIRC